MCRLLLILLLLTGPAVAQTPPGSGVAARRQLASQLLDALKLAPDEGTAAALENRIRTLWMNTASPAVLLLVGRSLRELQASTPADALEDIGAALDLQPDFAAAWALRASAEVDVGNLTGAVQDIEQALQFEPRQFDALQTLSRIAEQRRDWKGAYAAWGKLMELDPKTPGGAARLKDLRRRALGDEL